MVDIRYSENGKRGCAIRWKQQHSCVRISNRLSKEKVSINAYLCGDGYITIRKDKNNEVHNDIQVYPDNLLLANFIVSLFEKEFNICPTIKKLKGYFSVRIKNKPACEHLLSFGSYGSLNWKMPEGLTDKFTKTWIRCFFDCEAHVNTYNRQIQVKSVNKLGLQDIQSKLAKLGISSKVYGPYKQKLAIHNDYFLLTIYGFSNLNRYQKLISFNHPDKKIALAKIL